MHAAENPNGIPSQSPGLAWRSYPANASPAHGPTPTELRLNPTHMVHLNRPSVCCRRAPFVLKTQLPLMFLLPGKVFFDLCQIRLADGEAATSSGL